MDVTSGRLQHLKKNSKNLRFRANRADFEQIVQNSFRPTALSGPAFDFFRRLPTEETASARALQDALKRECSTTALASDYALLFVYRRRQAGEPLPEFGDALKSLARKAYPSFTEGQIESLCKTHSLMEDCRTP